MKTLFKALAVSAVLALTYPAVAAGPGNGPLRTQADISKADFIKQAEARFTAMDSNKDGKITAAEHAAQRPGRGMGPGASMPAEVTKAQALKFAEDRFVAMDTNKDGKITADERQGSRGGKHGMKHGSRGMGPAASMPTEMTKEQHMKYAQDRFNTLDTNKDGKISAEERQAQRGMKRGIGQQGSVPAAK